MTILVKAKKGESKEAAMEREMKRHPGEKFVFLGESKRAGGETNEKIVGLIDGSADDQARVVEAIEEIRRPWGKKIIEARKSKEISTNVDKSMRFNGGLAGFMRPMRLMSVCEMKLGKTLDLSNGTKWEMIKYYNIVSNFEGEAWNRGSTVGITCHDLVDLSKCERTTKVIMEKSSFAEVKRLGMAAGEILGQDMPEADKLCRAMKFPKIKEGLTPQQRLSVSNVLKQANMGQNHLTRLVRGVLLALASDMMGKKILLKANEMSMGWLNYEPASIDLIYRSESASAIWCNLPNRAKFASFLPHLALGHRALDVPERIMKIKIPTDSNKVYVVSLGNGSLVDIEVDGNEIRNMLTCYAQSMACEEILERAYCVGGMLLLHDTWPSISLPCTLWASDLVRPAMATSHEIMPHKREWNLSEAIKVAKYCSDVVGLMVKEVMSSGWDHDNESMDEVLSGIGRDSNARRNELYRWLIENVTGESTGFLYNLDPLYRAREDVVKEINSTSLIKYWWTQEVKKVGNGSICSTLLCSNYTHIPSKNVDTNSARELSFLRQIGILKKGALYKRELRLRKAEVDDEKKRLIEGCIKEGNVSVLGGGVSAEIRRRRTRVAMTEWPAEPERSGEPKYDDDELSDVDVDECDDEDEEEEDKKQEKRRWGDTDDESDDDTECDDTTSDDEEKEKRQKEEEDKKREKERQERERKKREEKDKREKEREKKREEKDRKRKESEKEKDRKEEEGKEEKTRVEECVETDIPVTREKSKMSPEEIMAAMEEVLNPGAKARADYESKAKEGK